MKLFRCRLFLFVFLINHINVFAQTEVYRDDTTWKAYAYNTEKTLAFSGGFNNPQFGLGDLNNDGRNDLIVFEKGSLQIKTFINYGTPGYPDYRYRPSYARNFPEKNGMRSLNSYMKIEDLNCDNIPDLLTRGGSGFSIYYGYYSNGALHFNFYKDLYYTSLAANVETFDPNSFPTNGWLIKNTSGNQGWSRVTSGSNPAVSPKQGVAMAMFNANAMTAGSSALLISKSFRVSPNLKSEGKLSFWMYRDNTSSAADSISVYISPDTSLNNAHYIERIARCRTINQPDTRPSDGWYQYTFSFPMNVVGNTARLIFKGISHGGSNIFIDDVYWISSDPYGDVNAYVDPGGDIPGVADADNDGDLDFFAFYIGGTYINFYKNYQKEENLPCDSIHINLKDACWGKVAQGSSIQQTLGANCAIWQPKIPPAKVTHTGNTLCMFDYDGDGDLDYLNGGKSYSYIQYLQNGKKEYNYIRDSIISQDTAWQTNGHVYYSAQFPAAFHIDIDQDGNKDILVSPSNEAASENYKCIAFYKNTGTNTAPVFTYQTDTLLVDQTIDMGAGSSPMIYDYNKDGKPDLFIGGDGFFQSNGTIRARIAYYENSSSGNNKSFTLQNNNFLNIDSLNVQGAYPAVGDLDNDGLEDLVVGHIDGTISFYKNMASSASVSPQWQLTMPILKDINNVNIDSMQYAAPLIYDMDKDGKNDLIIGGRSGWLYYYKNTGAPGQLALQYQTNALGSVRSDPWNFFSGFSAPFIGRIDNTNTEYLVLGSNSGRIKVYTGFQNGNITTPYQLLDSTYDGLNTNLGLYSNFRSVPAFADFDGDGKYDMVMGNVLGGITILKKVPSSAVGNIPGADDNVLIYPNPAHEKVHISWTEQFTQSENIEVAIINLSGQKVTGKTFHISEKTGVINIEGIASGAYFCEVMSGSNRSVSKLIIIK